MFLSTVKCARRGITRTCSCCVMAVIKAATLTVTNPRSPVSQRETGTARPAYPRFLCPFFSVSMIRSCLLRTNLIRSLERKKCYGNRIHIFVMKLPVDSLSKYVVSVLVKYFDLFMPFESRLLRDN